MSLKNTLLQSIAALDRITSVDPKSSLDIPQDDEKSLYSIAASSYTSSHLRDEKLSIRRRASEPSLHHSVAISEKGPSLYSHMSSPRDEPDEFEPKLTLGYIAQVARNFLTVLLSFVTPAVAVCIIGLAADSINWGTGRGSIEAGTVNAVFIRDFNQTTHTWTRTVTRMLYIPSHYDTQTFSAMIVAGCVCTLGGFIVAPLSIVHYRSTGQSVKLTDKKRTSLFRVLLTCIILDAVMFIVALIVVVYARELFTNYKAQYHWSPYAIHPQYLRPPLPPSPANETWDLIDDKIRYYESPVHYNPANWNCHLQGITSSRMQHRIFEMCNEGVAATVLLAVLVGFQGLVMVLHGWAFWAERKSEGGIRWLSQRLGSEERQE